MRYLPPGALAACIACVLALSSPAVAPTLAKDLAGELQARQEQIKRTRQEMLRLTAEERRLFKNLAALEQRVARKEATLRDSREALEQASQRRARLEEDKTELAAKRRATRDELIRLTQALWPIHLQRQEESFAGLESWPEADRKFTWLVAVQKRLDTLRAEYEIQGQELETALAALSKAEETESKRMDTTQDAAGQLLAERLKLLKAIQEVRAKEVNLKQNLAEILADVARLDEELTSAQESVPRKINLAASKGKLPWPARGRIVRTFSSKSKGAEPRQGLGLALADGAPIKSVASGQVVHADTLRGFGQVIIVRHPGQFYSLYAYLGQARVELNQHVDGAQVIGSAGFYPSADGPGLYFELRKGQKAINPQDWLTK